MGWKTTLLSNLKNALLSKFDPTGRFQKWQDDEEEGVIYDLNSNPEAPSDLLHRTQPVTEDDLTVQRRPPTMEFRPEDGVPYIPESYLNDVDPTAELANLLNPMAGTRSILPPVQMVEDGVQGTAPMIPLIFPDSLPVPPSKQRQTYDEAFGKYKAITDGFEYDERGRLKDRDNFLGNVGKGMIGAEKTPLDMREGHFWGSVGLGIGKSAGKGLSQAVTDPTADERADYEKQVAPAIRDLDVAGKLLDDEARRSNIASQIQNRADTLALRERMHQDKEDRYVADQLVKIYNKSAVIAPDSPILAQMEKELGVKMPPKEAGTQVVIDQGTGEVTIVSKDGSKPAIPVRRSDGTQFKVMGAEERARIRAKYELQGIEARGTEAQKQIKLRGEVEQATLRVKGQIGDDTRAKEALNQIYQYLIAEKRKANGGRLSREEIAVLEEEAYELFGNLSPSDVDSIKKGTYKPSAVTPWR